MGGGAAGALARAGGEAIEREAMARAPIPVGTAIATTAGTLPYRRVVHAPTMEAPAMRTNLDRIARATRAALACADAEGLESLAIPGMGTGVGGADPNEAARAIVSEIRAFRPKKLLRIVLCGRDEEMVEAFRRAWAAPQARS
jgi:O-acetyl-ADP-ribose deacetylase (regulator of RNase III)